MPKSATPTLDSLKPSKRVIVKAYCDPTSDTFLNGKRSYRKAHPRTTDGTAKVEAHRVLTHPNVRQAVREELEAQAVTKEWIRGKLVKYVNQVEAKNPLGGASIIMDLAKLDGLIVEKREVTNLAPEKQSVIRSLVDRALTPVDTGHGMKQPSTSMSQPTETQ